MCKLVSTLLFLYLLSPYGDVSLVSVPDEIDKQLMQPVVFLAAHEPPPPPKQYGKAPKKKRRRKAPRLTPRRRRSNKT